MRVLVIGKGGREHAIVKAISLSSGTNEIHVVPGNPGMLKEAVCHDLSTSDHEALRTLAKQKDIELVVIGPEAELVNGLGDVFRELQIPVFGPSQDASQLEASKIVAKEFMQTANIPTAKSVIVDSVDSTVKESGNFTAPYILKADGLAAGKGVFICKDESELRLAAEELFEKKSLGLAGERALLEQNLPGWELSVLVLTDGEGYEILPLAQDHKRLGEGQTGPNTGGMGTVAPMQVSEDLMNRIEKEIVAPSILEIKKQNLLYRGVLFIGVMVTENGPMVLEYNVRFGDPETQVVMPLLDGNWADVLKGVAEGNLQKLDWKPLYATCVVLAADGYPESPVKGSQIDGDALGTSHSSYFLHAGTMRTEHGIWQTNGGRVMNAIGLGTSREESIRNAYNQSELVRWPNMRVRKDIGKESLATNEKSE